MTTSLPPLRYPRITIEFCVQCKWNLRAAYFAQELLQTFSTSIGEISLIPVTGGVFTITLYHQDTPDSQTQTGQTDTTSGAEVAGQQSDTSPRPFTTSVIWDRKRDNGFPETKELKNRVRNIIEPGKDMGHVDRALRKGKGDSSGVGGDVKQEGIATKEEKKTDETTMTPAKDEQSNVQATSERTAQVEGKPGIGGTSLHAEHAGVKSVVNDCEECAEILKTEKQRDGKD